MKRVLALASILAAGLAAPALATAQVAPIPEPASLSLLAVGAVVVGLAYRARRRS